MPMIAPWSRGRIAVFAVAMAIAARPAGAQDLSRWNVETATGPSHQLSFETTVGTWTSLTVSPDGRSIAFDLLGHIYEMPVEGGTARRLTDGRSWNLFPRYSPDGRWIAFSSDRSGSHNIWIMDRQGGGLRNVTPWKGNIYKAVWSADGRRIFAGASDDGGPNGLMAFELAGGRQVLAPGGGLNAAAAEPDGAGVLFEHGGRAVYPFGFNPYVIPTGGATIERLDLATGEITKVMDRIGGAFAPALSPDGKLLAYVNRHIDDTRLIVRDLAARRDRDLLSGLDRDRQTAGSDYGPYFTMAWHPDGRRLFLNKGGKLIAVDVTTGATTPVPFRAQVERPMSETIRFKTREPDDRARTRTHRWGSRTAQGILVEALGDLWLEDAGGARRNLTRSAAHETSPVLDPNTGLLYYASWTDDSLGAVYRMPMAGGPAERLTSIPAQYGSIAPGPDGAVAYVRSAGGVERGVWLSNESDFELVLRTPAGERRLAAVSTPPLVYADIAGKVPPSVTFAPDGRQIWFTSFERDTLVLKRIGTDATGETVLYKFPHAISAVPSPDLKWIAVREYQRSFVLPMSYAGHALTVSPFEGTGSGVRVDAEDGGYLTWSADSRTLAWTRATGFYEKELDQILTEHRGPAPGGDVSAAAWNGPRVPGSTARRTETAIDYEIDTPKGTVALTGVRVLTMNPGREVIEGATIVIKANRIMAIGKGAAIPAGAKVFDLAGTTVMPGMIDAHAHPEIEHSALHVIEQQPTNLSGPLAYGVTTVVEIYGNEYRDGWLTDMIRAGKITGPRFFTTGSVIFGQRNEFRARMYRPIETLADALEQLRWNRDHGAIAVKDYAQDTRIRRNLTLTAARMLGLNVVSESSGEPQMNLTQLMDGVTGIEHSMGLVPFYDDIVKYWGGTTAGNTPTLLVVYNGAMGEGWYHQGSKLWEDPKLTRFIAPEQLMRIRNTTHLWPEDMTAWKIGAEERKLFANGTSVQVGAHGQMFGLDTHWELDLLKKSGFTPAQVLEIATIRGATYHGLDQDLGSLEVGKLADLVVLDANPLDDIANAQKIRYVMKNGVLHSGADAARVWPDPRPARKPYFAGRQ